MTRGTVLAIASGKGGVGKTHIAINLAVALQRMGHQVGLLDADFALGNVDVLLGLAPASHLGQVLDGTAALDDVVITGPGGLQIVPTGSGLQSLTSLSATYRSRLEQVVATLRSRLDFVIVDTAPGISDAVMHTLRMADRIAVVTSLEPAAVVDAYATAKVLATGPATPEIGIVVNAVQNGDDAIVAYRQLDVAASRFLGRSLRYYGFVADDPIVRESVLTQRAVVEHQPDARASRCFRILASRVAGLGPTPGQGLRLVSPPSTSVAEATRCA
jgi:flagellar biosynthesis protein FlhG